MRIKLVLNHPPNQVLPIDYQYLISSWIYHTLGAADGAFATHLHDQGYDFRGRKYKFFTFDALRPQWYTLDKVARTFILAKPPTELELSFYVEKAVQHFVTGLFKGQQFSFSSGRFQVDFEVASVELMPKPKFQTRMQFRTKSAICVSKGEEGKKHAQYQSPEDADYGDLLLRNLIGKKMSLVNQAAEINAGPMDLSFPYQFQLQSKPKPKLYTIKGTNYKGYEFDFALTAPLELMELGYFAGFGEKNSSAGLGLVEQLK